DALAFKTPDLPGLLDFYTRFGFRTARAEVEKKLGMGGSAAPASKAKAAKPGKAAKPSDTGDLFGGDVAQAMDKGDEVPIEVSESALSTLTQLDTHYDTILDWPAFDQWLGRINAAELVAFDTETDSLDPMKARVVGLSFSDKVGSACYIPLRHEGPDAPEQLPLDEVLAKLKPWLEDPGKPKVGQNIKYDTHVLANHGIHI